MEKRMALKEILERARQGRALNNRYIYKCLDDFLALSPKDILDDILFMDNLRKEFDIEDLNVPLSTFVLNIGEGEKEPRANPLFYICFIAAFDKKSSPAYKILNRFQSIMVPDFVDVICKLPKIEGKGRIARMDFKKAFDEWVMEDAKDSEGNYLTMEKLLRLCNSRLVSYHDSTILVPPWKDKPGTYKKGGPYLDEQEMLESSAATMGWLIMVCSMLRYIMCKEMDLIR